MWKMLISEHPDADDLFVLWDRNPNVFQRPRAAALSCPLRRFQATIDIASLTVIEGELPRRALVLAGDWGALHQAELRENWRLCREKAQPGKIEPLA